MHKMEELRDMLCKELEAITDRGELSAGSLDIVDKLTHSIKSIDTILAMENYDDYSNDEMYYDDRSEARGRGRNAKRDSMGRYSRDRYSRDRYSRDGYSMDDYSMDDGYSMDGDFQSELEQLMNDAPNDQIKQKLQSIASEM